MKLSICVILSNAGNQVVNLPNAEPLTTADMAAVPMVGDRVAVPGHVQPLLVDSRVFIYFAGVVGVQLFCKT